MKRLWAPWRLGYILGPKEVECIFCEMSGKGKDKDGESYILHRGELNFIVLNIYPYNNGHLMIVPYRHTDDITNMTEEELAEMGILTKRSVEVLKERFKPQGFNIGMNIGSAAGAGIEEHVHMHIVPRWNGDSNFMPVVGKTKVLPQLIGDTYRHLAEAFKKL